MYYGCLFMYLKNDWDDDKQNILFNVLTLGLQERSITSTKNFYFVLHSFLTVIITFIAETKLHKNLFFIYS